MIEEVSRVLVNTLGEDLVIFNEPMSKHTTFKIGGPADIFIMPSNIEQIKNSISICNENNVPYYVIGRGSNLLVGDKGFRGVIICISNNFDNIEISNEDGLYRVKAQSGVMLSKLSHFIADNGCEGFEFAAGIPGTLGGAVAMNAGAYGGEIKDCIISAVLMDELGEIRSFSKEELQLGYRTSIVLKNTYIVLEAVFEFNSGNRDDIYSKIEDFNKRRRDKQPLEYPSAGSTFKRPEGYFAGKLIMDSGLAGFNVGDAYVSDKHCGFVINKGKATAKDTVKLIKKVDDIVYKNYGIHLEPEVRIIGEF